MRENSCGVEGFRNLLSGLEGADMAADVKLLARHSIVQMEGQRALMCISLAEDAISGNQAGLDDPEWRGPRGILGLFIDYFAARAAENRVNGDPAFIARTLMGMLFQLVVARKLWGNQSIEPETTDALVDIFLNGVVR
jgi:hypothetical protein